MTQPWAPPRRRPEGEMRPSRVRILDAKGRLVKIIEPEFEGLPCWHHSTRGCPDCVGRLDRAESAR